MMMLIILAFATMFFTSVCLRQHGNGEGNWGRPSDPVIVTRNP